MLELLEAPPRSAPGAVLPRRPGTGADPLRTGLLRISVAAGARPRRARPRAAPGRDGRARGRERRRQEHRCEPPPAFRRADRGTRDGRRRRPRGVPDRRLAAALAWVPQRPTIFRGTVADNIRLGAPRASEHQTREAAMLAGADHFVRGAAAGATRRSSATAEGRSRPGSAGGSRSRGRSSRCAARDPRRADRRPRPASAELVAEAVERLRAGAPCSLIAHRAELVRRADRVVPLDGGGIVVRRRRRHDDAPAPARAARVRGRPCAHRCCSAR